MFIQRRCFGKSAFVDGHYLTNRKNLQSHSFGMIFSYTPYRALMVPILHSMALDTGGANMRIKVLVTGATGCSGSHQLNNILHNHAGKYELHATKRARSALDLIDPNWREATSFYVVDLTRAFAVASLIAKTEPGIILHYAADTFVPPSSDNQWSQIRPVLSTFCSSGGS